MPSRKLGLICLPAISIETISDVKAPIWICREVIREFCDADMPILVPADYPRHLKRARKTVGVVVSWRQALKSCCHVVLSQKI